MFSFTTRFGYVVFVKGIFGSRANDRYEVTVLTYRRRLVVVAMMTSARQKNGVPAKDKFLCSQQHVYGVQEKEDTSSSQRGQRR
jgi:hypothetical protein